MQAPTAAGLPATFQLLYAVAFNGTREPRGNAADHAAGEFVVPLENLKRRRP